MPSGENKKHNFACENKPMHIIHHFFSDQAILVVRSDQY
jgi:hypothetical protein